MNAPEITEDQKDEVYDWIDRVPLTRPRKNLNRDFSDGVLFAQVLAHFLPEAVVVGNYAATNNVTVKMTNWSHLNQKVLKKMNFQISKGDLDHIITETPEVLERVLKQLRIKINTYNKRKDEPSKETAVLYKLSQNPNLRSKIQEQDREIAELREVVSILGTKVAMMENLVSIKDNKIQALVTKLEISNLL